MHKALDQIGAVSGPLLVAAVIAALGLWAGPAVLVVPGLVAMTLLVWLRIRVPDPGALGDPAARPAKAPPKPTPAPGLGGWLREGLGAGLGRPFFGYALSVALTTGGLVTFALIAVHLTEHLGLPVGAVPLVYAGAMLVEAVLAPLVGRLYDRIGPKVLLAVPVLVATVPALAFGPGLAAALVGVLLWAAAAAIQDSSIKALVAELVPAHRLGTGYGVFAGVQGAFAVLGGGLAGWLLGVSLPALVAVIAAAQLVALVLLRITLRQVAPARTG